MTNNQNQLKRAAPAKIDVTASSPCMWIHVDADEFGRIFSNMAADDQAAVFRAMLKHMGRHPAQWDYLAIELEAPENSECAREFLEIFASVGETP